MKQTVDLLLTGGKLVNVFSGEIYPENVAIKGGKIAGFGNYPARKTIDLGGKYICPGFIEGHIHIESTMVGLGEFARTVCVSGTTSVVADPHEIAINNSWPILPNMTGSAPAPDGSAQPALRKTT